MVGRRAFLAGLLCTVASAASAQSFGLGLGIDDRKAAGSFPLDGLTVPAAAYSLRKLRSAYTGPALRVQRASDTTQQDIGFVGFVPGLGSPLDVAAAGAFCAATVCRLRTWYDQSGLGRHADGGDGTTSATLEFNCLGYLPCLRSGSSWTNGPSVTPSATGTLAAVGKVESAPATCAFLRYGSDRALGSNASGAVWLLWNNGSGFTAPAANGAAHAAVGVFNGASSVLNIDGTETTGTVPATIAAGNIYVATNHDAVIRCQHFEAIWWDNYIMPPAERAVVVNNQRGFWGF